MDDADFGAPPWLPRTTGADTFSAGGRASAPVRPAKDGSERRMVSLKAYRTWALAAAPLLLQTACSPSPEPAAHDGVRADTPTLAALVDPAWEVQYRDSTRLFIGMSVVDANTVWVAGQPGTWGRTTDGGATWTVSRVPGAEDMAFRDVHAFSADEAFLLSIGNGAASRIYRTADGGESWTLSFENQDPNAFFDCLSFWDRNRGFAFSDAHEGEFTLIRTEDGGGSWTRVDPAHVPDARPGEGAFAASGTCVETGPDGLGWFVTGASGVDTRVMRTTDYGATWSEAPTPVPSGGNTEGLASVAFRDALHGAVFGSAEGPEAVNVATTADGGLTWSPAGVALGGIVYGGAVVPGTPTPTWVAVSPRGSAWSHDDGRTWTTFDTVNTWTVAFLSADVGWAGGRGHISRILNRGAAPDPGGSPDR